MQMNRCVACGSNWTDQNACMDCGFRPSQVSGFVSFAPDLDSGLSGFDPGQHELLARYEADNFWFRARNLLIVHMLRKHAPAMRAFLEIGCGTGFVLSAIKRFFPGTSIVGSELHVEGLRHAAKRLPHTYLIQMDARAIPYADSFDAVGAFDVIEHIKEDECVLAQARDALTADGLLLLTVPQHMWLWSQQDELARHVRRYSRKELVDKVRGSGFEILRVTSFVTALLPAMLLSRKRGRTSNEKHDPLQEFCIPLWLNMLLYAVMRVEIALIKRGLSLPFGGSLLLVARKKTTDDSF